MPTVCILYGLGEGPKVGFRLEKALAAKGHSIVNDAESADIIITHSGGFLLVPKDVQAGQIVHIAPYHWPRTSWFAAMGRKLLDDFRHHRQKGELKFWAHKTCWNAIYFWNMSRNLRMLRAIKTDQRWRRGGITVVARPRFDTFCAPDPELLPFRPDTAFVSMPGHHDDCWLEPEPYILQIKTGKI